VRHSITSSTSSSGTATSLAHDVAMAQAMAAADPYEESTQEGSQHSVSPPAPLPPYSTFAHPSESAANTTSAAPTTAASLESSASIYPEFSQTTARSDLSSSSSSTLDLDQAASDSGSTKDPSMLENSPIRNSEDEVIHS